MHVLLQGDGVRVQRQLGGGEQRRAVAARVVLGLALLDEVLLRQHGLHCLVLLPLLLLVLLSLFISASFSGGGQLWLLLVFICLSALVLRRGLLSCCCWPCVFFCTFPKGEEKVVYGMTF